MAPIYDTDIAEERWSKSEWNHYELWEKVEVRLRRRKWLWVSGTVVLFLILSAVPVVTDQYPRWRALSAVRKLAQQINFIKRQATIEEMAYRIRFVPENSLNYVVEQGSNCSATQWKVVNTGTLARDSAPEDYVLMNQHTHADMPGLLTHFCYDDLAGSDAVFEGKNAVGFGVMPVKDLTSGRSDRAAIVTLSGPSAEISFE